ncbi:bleomycin hydrolase [Thecaphora frezii]
MGSAASKPATSSSQATPYAEKALTTTQLTASQAHAYDAHNHQHHPHAADRLARIHAESTLRLSRASASSGRSDAQVSLEAVGEWNGRAFASPTSRLAALTLHNAEIGASLHTRTAEVLDQHVYSHTIPFECANVTNQKRSGRCWLFATTNVIRVEVAQRLGLESFELSQSYLSFYDKLEKANYFLENMIELADEPLDGRVVDYLKTDPTSDGGQWDMVANLLEKYGVVPKAVFPESFNSSDTRKINWLCTVKLREYTLELRELRRTLLRRLDAAAPGLSGEAKAAAVTTALRQRKDEQMAEIYRIMAISLGAPPRPDDSFTFNYRDKHGKFHRIEATPKTFLRDYTGAFDHKTRCSLVHDPRHAPERLITIDRLGNVWGGSPVLYVNTTMHVMSAAVVASISAGQPVFFGCDVGQFSDTASGIMDPALFGYELAFNVQLGLSKEERIQMGESAMTHAMVITGVHVEDGKVKRYRVENSWGSDGVGDRGYMCMTQKWFEEYNFQVVLDRRFVPKKLWALFEKGVDGETIVLPPYDPLGTLA